MIDIEKLKKAKIVVDDQWLKYEIKKYIEYITDPIHEEKCSNYHYLKAIKQYEKNIRNAINKGDIVL